MHSYRDISNPTNRRYQKGKQTYKQNKNFDFTQSARPNKNTFSFSPTNFETYPHNEYQDLQKQYNNEDYQNTEKQEQDEEVQFSNYETSFDEYLHQVSEELQLKTVGIDMAIKMVQQVQKQKKKILIQLRNTQTKLHAAQQRIFQLQQQVSFVKSMSSIKPEQHQILPLQSADKKSVAKMIITRNKLPLGSQTEQPLKMISIEMFLKYAEQYDDIFQKLSSYIEKQNQQQQQIILQNKVENYALQCEQILNAGKNSPVIQNNQLDPKNNQLSVSLEAYNQLFNHYKQYEKKMETIIIQCLNFIQKISNPHFSGLTTDLEFQKFGFRDFTNIIPPQLVQIITKEVYRKFQVTLQSLKRDNKQLKAVLEGLISWVKRNLGQNKMQQFNTSQRNYTNYHDKTITQTKYKNYYGSGDIDNPYRLNL